MRAAIAFLTPFGGASTPSRRAMGWFPFVGIAIGLAVGGLWWGANHVLPTTAAAAIAVVGDAVFTGCLHLDGVADAADGLLPPMSRARRLEVMRDPAVGAFGLVAVALLLLLRFAVFASVAADPLVVGALWGTSRSAMVVISRSMPYARQGGLASAFLADAPSEPASGRSATDRSVALVGVGLVICLALSFLGSGLHGVAALGAAAAGCGGVALLARARLGGFTGDVLGAAGVFGETVGLVALAVR